MKYVKTLKEQIETNFGKEEVDNEDNYDVNTSDIETPEETPVELPKPAQETETSDGEEITDVHWTACMEGAGDYILTFRNADGENVTCTFKDTGNRRKINGMMGASFVILNGTSSDGRSYVAEAYMKPNDEGNYEIESFSVYEH